jgi:hypothetical protein
MISIGVVLGEPEQDYSQLSRSLTAATIAIDDITGVDPAASRPDLNAVFHFPGRMLAPDWEGIRCIRFSRKRRALLVGVAVPSTMIDSTDAPQFVIGSLRGAVTIATDAFERKGITYPKAEAEDLIDRMEARIAQGA